LSQKYIDIICPVFREAEGIQAFHSELAAVMDKLADDYISRVLYVMDPSVDDTESRLAEICAADARATTIVLSRRFGHQAALVAGMDHARGDAVVMLDSDGQHPPEVILELVEAFERGADVVQAVRKDAPRTGWFKRTASETFYKLMSRVAAIDMRVGSADFRLLSSRVVDVFRDQLPERNPFIRGLTSWVGFTVAYVGFTSRERVTGESKYSLRLLIEFAITGVTSFSKVPIRAAAVLGTCMSTLSALYGFIAIAAYFTRSFVAPGWTSLLAVVAFMGGLQLFFLGLIAEYVGQIFDEVKGRPRYLISKTIGEIPQTPSPESPADKHAV
jgi:glycosyltransferase involved in cell wall biosynthesis